jgi:hypothetical protein
MKIQYLNLTSCQQCPYSQQDEYGVHCTNYKPWIDEDGMEYNDWQILNDKEMKNKVTVKEKYGSDIPPFCPLPEIDDFKS